MNEERERGLGHWMFLRLAVTGLVLTAGVVLLALATDGLQLRPLLACLGVQYLAVGLGYLSIRRGVRIEAVQSVQLVVEVLVIAVCVHFTGGLHSPFTLLYFFPLLLAAYELKQKGALYVAGFTAALTLGYTLLVSAERLAPPPIEFREGVVSNGALLGAHVTVSLLLVVGYLAGELAGRVSRKTRQLARKSEELERSQRETQSILDNMGSGVLTLDLEGVVQRMNPAGGRILGVAPEVLVGRPAADGLGAIMPVFVGHLMEGVFESVATERTELHIERQDGEVVPLGLSVNPMLGVDGERVGVVAVFQDLSAVVRMRDRMRANDRLAAMGELSASIAHEIRNPLASIRGSVEMLQGELVLEGEMAGLFELVCRESERLNRIVENFLEFARLKPLAPRNCRLTDLLEDLRRLIEARGDLPGGSALAVGTLPGDLVVNVDEELMRQVFLNLALNAFDEMGAGGTLTVTVSVLPEAGPPEVVIRFLDEGGGIDEEILGRVFEPFFTTKTQGTGLGLPLANRIVVNHEGRIAAHNLDGGGAEFAVHLPLVGFWRDGVLVRGASALEEFVSETL